MATVATAAPSTPTGPAAAQLNALRLLNASPTPTQLHSSAQHFVLARAAPAQLHSSPAQLKARAKRARPRAARHGVSSISS